MCSLQTGKYPIEFYWYAAISVPALFPRVGNSIPVRHKRKCIQSYLSCPAAVLSVDQLPLCYNLSFVHRSLSPKSSYVMYWSSSWRALRPAWNTETVEHVIEVCTKFTEARRRLKHAVEDLGINLSTPEILRSTAAAKHVEAFVRESGIRV